MKLGSYPGRPMIVRLTGEQEDVAGAASLVRGTLVALEDAERAAQSAVGPVGGAPS